MADIRQEMRDAPYCAVFVYGKGRKPLEVAVAATVFAAVTTYFIGKDDER